MQKMKLVTLFILSISLQSCDFKSFIDDEEMIETIDDYPFTEAIYQISEGMDTIRVCERKIDGAGKLIYERDKVKGMDGRVLVEHSYYDFEFGELFYQELSFPKHTERIHYQVERDRDGKIRKSTIITRDDDGIQSIFDTMHLDYRYTFSEGLLKQLTIVGLTSAGDFFEINKHYNSLEQLVQELEMLEDDTLRQVKYFYEGNSMSRKLTIDIVRNEVTEIEFLGQEIPRHITSYEIIGSDTILIEERIIFHNEANDPTHEILKNHQTGQETTSSFTIVRG